MSCRQKLLKRSYCFLILESGRAFRSLDYVVLAVQSVYDNFIAVEYL